MITSPVYAPRRTVTQAMDVATTARDNTQIDRVIQSAARQIDQACRRVFYPTAATRFFDLPVNFTGAVNWPWQLHLHQHELITATSVQVGAVTIPLGDVRPEPENTGPPFNRLEIRLTSGVSYVGVTSWRRAVAVGGLYGHRNDESPAGTITEALDTVEVDVDVDGPAAVALDAGCLIRVDSERMLVTDVESITAGITITNSPTASMADVTVTASNSAITVGEVILIDSERMLVIDRNGSTLTVKRAWDGTVLAAHTVGAVISFYRRLIVTRGALGTTAATHTTAAPVTRHLPPPLVEQTNVELALYKLGNELAGARDEPVTPVGQGSTSRSQRRALSPVETLLSDLVSAHGRRLRTRTI